jgi:hypothetical protein
MMMAGTGIPTGSDLPASLLDICPTRIDQAGLTPKPELEGLSLVSLLANPASGYRDIPVASNLRGRHISFAMEPHGAFQW